MGPKRVRVYARGIMVGNEICGIQKGGFLQERHTQTRTEARAQANAKAGTQPETQAQAQAMSNSRAQTLAQIRAYERILFVLFCAGGRMV